MAWFQAYKSTNIDCIKKVLLALLVIMVIVLYLMNGFSTKTTFLSDLNSEQNRIIGGLSNSISVNSVGQNEIVENRYQYKIVIVASNASDGILNISPEIKNSTHITNRQDRNKTQNEDGNILKDVEAKRNISVQNEAPTSSSAEEFYKDPRNILPSDLDPVRASNVSWVSFLSQSEKESIYKEYAKMGIESTELHSFKSPYIIDPRIYRTPETANATSNKGIGSSQVKKKIISCYACKDDARIYWPLQFNENLKRCPYCQLDIEGKMVQEAEAVVFFPVVIGERPVPKRPIGQIWIMAEWESPVHFHYPKSYDKWKSGFNWTFTYRTDSDIFAPYNNLAWRKRDLLLSDEEYLSIAKQKTKTAAWFVSNCNTESRRQEYVKKLQEFIDVDIYGNCGPKKCPRSKNDECTKLLTTTYKFYLSFENSFCKDYVTEKLLNRYDLRTHVIPVTRGGFEYHKYIPPGGYVNAADFKSPKELGLFLKELGNDVKRYAEMLKEKDRLLRLGYKVDWCNICEKLHTRSASENKIIPDIKNWSHDNTCFMPPV